MNKFSETEGKTLNNKARYLFSIPDASTVRTINMALFGAMREHSEWFYDDFVIESSYGCPVRCIWNGNRQLLGQSSNVNTVGGILGIYCRFVRIIYRLTFTNFLLEKKHLQDEGGNAIATIASSNNCSAIVSTRLMYDYIGEKYPKLSRTWSTTTDFGTSMPERIAKINELSVKDMVVLPYDMNNKPVLREFTHPENIEVLVNEPCMDNCPMRQAHYNKCNRLNLISDTIEAAPCMMQGEKNSEVWQLHSMINREGLRKYANSGINHFKISGRDIVPSAIGAYLHYFVKKEYWNSYFNYCEEFNRIILEHDGTLIQEIYMGSKYSFIDDETLQQSLEIAQKISDWGSINIRLW